MYLTIVSDDDSKKYKDLPEDMPISYVTALVQTLSLIPGVKSVWVNVEPLKSPKSKD